MTSTTFPFKPLAVVPTYLQSAFDVDVLNDCLAAIRDTEGERVDIVVVDDASPVAEHRVAVMRLTEHWRTMGIMRTVNGGFACAVNEGLRMALEEGRDAILINADLTPTRPWLDRMLVQTNLTKPGLASVVGGLLTYPEGGLIQHGGIYFSLLTRQFDHLWKFAPDNLPAAQKPRTCPVTGAFQFIRHECLAEVGLYDEEYVNGFEDVDYCIRVFLAERECVYQPKVRALHHEAMFRSRARLEWVAGFRRLMEKWGNINFAEFVPFA